MEKHEVVSPRKIGVRVRLDPSTVASLDSVAERASVSRSELLRRMIEECMEDEAAERWVAESAEAALREVRVPWEQAKAELGL
jgi:metal-responsive CopG/Arc/MetJ family transcriptional regulator